LSAHSRVVEVGGEVCGVNNEFDAVGNGDDGDGDESQSEEPHTDGLVESCLRERVEEADHCRPGDTHGEGSPSGVEGGEAGV